MGICSDKKRSSSAGVAVWCVVLGLALLVVDAAGKEGGGRAAHLAEEHGDAAYCLALCKGRSKSDIGPCYNECLYGRVTGQEEARGVGGVGGRAGVLAMPTERAGREEEEKGKQTDAVVRLTDPVWCYDACHGQDMMPYDQCVKECYAENLPDAARLSAHGGLGGEEEARGVGADALTAAAAGIHKCDWFRDCSVTPCVWHCGKRRVQEEDDEETRTGALNVLAAARREVAVGPCSGTVYVDACYVCCQRESFKEDPGFDWDACIRCCDDEHSHPIKKEQEKNKDGVVPPAK